MTPYPSQRNNHCHTTLSSFMNKPVVPVKKRKCIYLIHNRENCLSFSHHTLISVKYSFMYSEILHVNITIVAMDWLEPSAQYPFVVASKHVFACGLTTLYCDFAVSSHL